MHIDEASLILKNLLTHSDNKSEKKIYEAFIATLDNLSKRDLTEEEIQSLGIELDNLDLKGSHENRKKHFKKKLYTFNKYIKEKLNLISDGYYTGIGIALGMSFGLSLGVGIGSALGIENGLVFGMIIGMLIGLIIGSNKDSDAKKEGRVIFIKSKNQ